MLGTVFFSGYAMAEAVHMQDSTLLDNLKIVPSPSMIGMVRDMKSIVSYVSEDEKFDGEGIKIKHDGRMFVVSKAEDVEGAVNILKKYPAPTEEVIKTIKSSDGKGIEGNFIIYFLDNSGYKEKLVGSREGLNVFVSTDPALASLLDASIPGIYGYNGRDRLSYKFPFSDKNATKIFSLTNLPIFGFTSAESISLYRSLDGTIFYIFFNPSSSLDVLNGYSGVLDDFRYDVRVILIPSVKDGINLEDYGLTEKDLPGCISISEDGGKYILRNVTKESISEFVKDVLGGKAEAFYKSQEEPKDNGSKNVKVVTRNNSKTYLGDVSKDRLVVFGTERCPHCIRIKPTLEKLGEIVKNNADDKVFIGYCDVDMNDMNDVEIRFVPTILLYKAGENKSIQYSGGERNLLNLITFIRESGSLGVDLSKFAGQEDESEKRKFEAGKEATGSWGEDARAEL